MEYRMVAALQRRKLNMFKLREGKFSPRALVWGNPSRAKFAAENRGNIFSLRSGYRGLAKPASSSRTELNWTELNISWVMDHGGCRIASPAWQSHSGHVGNTRRQRLITCCCLWRAAQRFWPGQLISPTRRHGWTVHSEMQYLRV